MTKSINEQGIEDTKPHLRMLRDKLRPCSLLRRFHDALRRDLQRDKPPFPAVHLSGPFYSSKNEEEEEE